MDSNLRPLCSFCLKAEGLSLLKCCLNLMCQYCSSNLKCCELGTFQTMPFNLSVIDYKIPCERCKESTARIRCVECYNRLFCQECFHSLHSLGKFILHRSQILDVFQTTDQKHQKLRPDCRKPLESLDLEKLSLLSNKQNINPSNSAQTTSILDRRIEEVTLYKKDISEKLNFVALQIKTDLQTIRKQLDQRELTSLEALEAIRQAEVRGCQQLLSVYRRENNTLQWLGKMARESRCSLLGMNFRKMLKIKKSLIAQILGKQNLNKKIGKNQHFCKKTGIVSSTVLQSVQNQVLSLDISRKLRIQKSNPATTCTSLSANKKSATNQIIKCFPAKPSSKLITKSSQSLKRNLSNRSINSVSILRNINQKQNSDRKPDNKLMKQASVRTSCIYKSSEKSTSSCSQNFAPQNRTIIKVQPNNGQALITGQNSKISVSVTRRCRCAQKLILDRQQTHPNASIVNRAKIS